MNKHLIVIGIVVILLVVGLCGCNEISNPLTGNDDSRFVGTWKTEPGLTITFFSDGTGSFTGLGFNWEIKDGKLVRETDVTGVLSTEVYDFQFSDNDTTLTLTNVGGGGTPIIYTKQ